MPASDKPDFAVLHPDGRVVYGHRRPGDALLNSAIRAHIPDLGTQGLGHCRVWFSDTFTPSMPPNPVADRVITQLGYVHRLGWFGVVAVSMEEEWDGVIPPLTSKIRAVIDSAQVGGGA